jgi:hypothetical protein
MPPSQSARRSVDTCTSETPDLVWEGQVKRAWHRVAERLVWVVRRYIRSIDPRGGLAPRQNCIGRFAGAVESGWIRAFRR